jgi:hypothetical protein
LEPISVNAIFGRVLAASGSGSSRTDIQVGTGIIAMWPVGGNEIRKERISPLFVATIQPDQSEDGWIGTNGNPPMAHPVSIMSEFVVLLSPKAVGGCNAVADHRGPSGHARHDCELFP